MRKIYLLAIALTVNFFFGQFGGIEPPCATAFTEPPTIPVNKPTPTNTVTVCSSGCNYSSISAADNAAQPGWVIRVKAGTYSAITWNTSGTSDSPIVIEAYGDGKVYINGKMQFNGNYIIVDGKNSSSPQIVFDGGSNDGAIKFGYDQGAAGNNITLYRCEVTGGSVAMQLYGGDYAKIYNCRIHDPTGESHAVYYKHGLYSEIRNNIIYNFDRNGIQTNPHDSGNTVRDAIISGNAIYNCGENGLSVLSGTGPGGLLDGLIIRNNLIWASSENAIRFTGGENFAGTIRDVEVYGNTFYGNIDNQHGTGGKAKTTKFKNNIVTGRVNNTGGFIEYSNNVVGSTSCLASTSSSSADFLKLKSSASNCINQGATGLSLTNDYFGNSRDSQPDIGAYEYGGGAPSPSLTGDVDSNGTINIQDIQACINHLLGTQDYGTAADVNQDGNVNVLDVQEIVNIILG